MAGNGNRFFVKVNGSAGEKAQGTRNKEQEESFNLLHLTKIVETRIQDTRHKIQEGKALEIQ